MADKDLMTIGGHLAYDQATGHLALCKECYIKLVHCDPNFNHPSFFVACPQDTIPGDQWTQVGTVHGDCWFVNYQGAKYGTLPAWGRVIELEGFDTCDSCDPDDVTRIITGCVVCDPNASGTTAGLTEDNWVYGAWDFSADFDETSSYLCGLLQSIKQSTYMCRWDPVDKLYRGTITESIPFTGAVVEITYTPTTDGICCAGIIIKLTYTDPDTEEEVHVDINLGTMCGTNSFMNSQTAGDTGSIGRCGNTAHSVWGRFIRFTHTDLITGETVDDPPSDDPCEEEEI